MKIVIIGKENHLQWDNNVVDAFKRLGHEVFHFQINKRPNYIQLTRGVLKGLIGKNKASTISDNMYVNTMNKSLEDIKPDLIITTSACFIPSIFYEMFKSLQSKPKVFAWEGDGGLEQNKNSYMKSYIDVMLDMSEDPIKRNTFKFKNIFHLPAATNEKIFKNLNLKRDKKIYFCGNMNQDRNEFFSTLNNYELVLTGLNWENLNAKDNNFIIKKGLVQRDQLLKDYNSYISALNYHQKEVASYKSGLNMRAFEVLSTKTLLINDYRDNIEDLFDIEKEICVYRTTDELKEILDRLKKYPQEFESIRENGYKRVLAEHTYVHRMKKVIDIYNQL
ncbi:glycosyltransferase family protein [Arcobacter sp. YIC-464]|uniref:glycosyltransferase family protein n=1 Tax=Arcobacter sp. YIC-464 TaxID=3376631 RepID=UPI003C237D28